MRFLPLTTAILLFATIDAGAQTRYIPDSSGGGTCNIIPFGTAKGTNAYTNQHYQTMAMAADLGSPTGPIRICNIGFVSCGTSANIQHHDTIEIKLGQTNATSLSTTFSANLVANVQTVLKAKNFQWHQTGGVWERVGLDRNYVFLPSLGKNLVLDITVTGNSKPLGRSTGFRVGGRQRLYQLGNNLKFRDYSGLRWCIDIDAWSITHQGKGCNNLALRGSGSAELGKGLKLTTSGQPSAAPCLIVIGNQGLNPGFDLSVVRAPGCLVYCVPLLTISGPNYSGTVPKDRSLISQHLSVQSYCLSSTYRGGIATSNKALIIPGNAR